MKAHESKRRKCRRGRELLRSSGHRASDSRKRSKGDLPARLASPALRALLNARIATLSQLAKRSESEILPLHGIGPNGIKKLRMALESKGISFKK